jgi:SAM-dependent methyltransferase
MMDNDMNWDGFEGCAGRLDARFWAQAWCAARKASTMYKAPTDPRKWKAFWDFFAPTYAKRNREDRPLHERVVAHLADHGVVRSEDRVLDIGCGPGTYTLPLARRCRLITGLDSASAMLAVLSAEAKQEGIADRIVTDCRDWSDVPQSGRFDLVFGALTPAIKDSENLMRMNDISRRHCCLVSFKGRYHSRLRDGLWREIMGCDMESLAFDTQYPFNILYQTGYLPEVAFFPYAKKVQEEPEYVREHFTTYFAIFGKNGRETRRRIDAFVANHTHNGKVWDEQKGTLGVITWSVCKDPMGC